MATAAAPQVLVDRGNTRFFTGNFGVELLEGLLTVLLTGNQLILLLLLVSLQLIQFTGFLL